MTHVARFAGAAALAGVAVAPAAAQYYPSQPYPQYPQPGYAQPYGYNNGGVVGDIIDQLLGNRYNVTDRQAVRRCANAAMAQAASQYGGERYNGPDRDYYNHQGYNGPDRNYYNHQGYNGGGRVTAITDVQHRPYGVRVSGLMNNGYGRYGNQGYGHGQLSFRCNVDYQGAVTSVRVRPAGGY